MRFTTQRESTEVVNSRGCETLNALFGVAYDRTTLNPDPQLGNFGQPIEDKKGGGIEDTPITSMSDYGLIGHVERVWQKVGIDKHEPTTN